MLTSERCCKVWFKNILTWKNWINTCKAPCRCPNIGCDGIRKSFSLSEIFSSDRLYPRAADEDCAVHKKGYRSRENPPTNIIFLFLFGKKKGERKTKESYRISQVSILLEIREVGLVFHVGGMEKNIFSDNDYIKASAVRNDVKAISYSPVSSTVLSLPPSWPQRGSINQNGSLLSLFLSWLEGKSTHSGNFPNVPTWKYQKGKPVNLDTSWLSWSEKAINLSKQRRLRWVEKQMLRFCLCKLILRLFFSSNYSGIFDG